MKLYWNIRRILEYLLSLINMQSPSLNVVSSAQNKELLWSTLQESGAFVGLTQEQFEPVKLAFDRAVQLASRTMTGSLNDANKQIIRQFVQTELPALRSSANANANPINNVVIAVPKKKKIEMVYRAEDLQNERANEFERQLREKQAEMDSFLTLKKPTDVSFTDAAAVEDKPIGDEMSRLIAQELAARERELVQLKPEDIKKAQQWIGTNTSSVSATTATTTSPAKKTVSFSKTTTTNVVEERHENEPDPLSNDESNFEETDIFSKFKKINEPINPIHPIHPINPITMQSIYDKLIELEKKMHANHAAIMAHLFNACT